MRSCRQPIKGNMELPCRVPWERGYLNSRERSSREPTENVWVKRSSKIHQGKQFVRSDPFCFIKLSCLQFLWLGPSVRFATKWHLFLTISQRLLFFNVLGNVTSSLLLYVSLRDVNEILGHQQLLLDTVILDVLSRLDRLSMFQRRPSVG